MDIKYFINSNSGYIEAINMDNVKRIYIKYFKDQNENLGEVYFDDIKIYSIRTKRIKDKINQIINSDEEILKIYNLYVVKAKLREENTSKIFTRGYDLFREFIQSNVNFEEFIKMFNTMGIRPCIESLKDRNRIGDSETDNYIVSFMLIFMYLNHIGETA